MQVGIGHRPGRAQGTVVALGLLLASFAGVSAEAKEGKSTPASQQAEREKATSSGPETWYATTIARTEYGALIVHYWSKGALFRAETMKSGHQIVSIVNGKTYYVFDGATGRGAAIGRHANAMEEDATRGRSFGMELEELLRQGGERIGGGVLEQNGIEFEVFQITNKLGRTQVSIAASKFRLPFRVETFVRSTGETSILEYSEWQRGLKLADSFFAPPSQLELDRYSYEEYVTALAARDVSGAPVYYGHLLHGNKPD